MSENNKTTTPENNQFCSFCGKAVYEVKKQGVDKVIAVNFNSDEIDEESNVMDIVMKTIDIMGSKVSEESLEMSDYVLTVYSDKTGLLDTDKLDKIVMDIEFELDYANLPKEVSIDKRIVERYLGKTNMVFNKEIKSECISWKYFNNLVLY